MDSPTINLHNVDCMEFMRGLPDKAYDLAIVDPPYGIGNTWGKNRNDTFAKHKHTFNDAAPDAGYYDELRRVSSHQIIWGAQYLFGMLPTPGHMIFWDKGADPDLHHMSAGDFAWSSIVDRSRKVYFHWCGAVKCEPGKKIHPHQKPVALYRWLLQNYAKPGQRILDTHGGSMSIAIACDIEGYDLDLCEMDKDYFDAGKKRLEQHRAQPRLFDTPKPEKGDQLTIDDAA